MKSILLLCIFFLASIFDGHMPLKGETTMSNQATLINLAKKEAEKRGYNCETLDFHIDEENKYWLNFLANYSKSNPDIVRQLSDKDYSVIFFDSKIKNEPIFGGGGWILIDKTTSRVLLFQPMK